MCRERSNTPRVTWAGSGAIVNGRKLGRKWRLEQRDKVRFQLGIVVSEDCYVACCGVASSDHWTLQWLWNTQQPVSSNVGWTLTVCLRGWFNQPTD
jgi:hypothetical protein